MLIERLRRGGGWKERLKGRWYSKEEKIVGKDMAEMKEGGRLISDGRMDRSFQGSPRFSYSPKLAVVHGRVESVAWKSANKRDPVRKCRTRGMDPFQFREWFAILAVTKRANPFVSRGNYLEGEGGRGEKRPKRQPTGRNVFEQRRSPHISLACGCLLLPNFDPDHSVFHPSKIDSTFRCPTFQ